MAYFPRYNNVYASTFKKPYVSAFRKPYSKPKYFRPIKKTVKRSKIYKKHAKPVGRKYSKPSYANFNKSYKSYKPYVKKYNKGFV